MRPSFPRKFSVLSLSGLALALSGCFVVENGPAFSGGDEVPGFAESLYAIGRISGSEGIPYEAVELDEVAVWSVRRAVNGSYILTPEADEDIMVVRPRRIDATDYVIEYSPNPDENWLGILNLYAGPQEQRYHFCISLDRDEDMLIQRAQQHGLHADDSPIAGISLDTDDPDRLFAYMADLRETSEIYEWECTVLSDTPPVGYPAAPRSKTPNPN